MKNQTRINKLLTALLVLCVLFVCMAGTAMAEEDCNHNFVNNSCQYCGVPGGYCGAENYGRNVVWTLDDDVLTFSGTGAMTDYTGQTQRPWNNSCGSITSIVIEDGITSVGNYAVYGCTSLTSITIPNGVTSIGNYAVYRCTSLTGITIPNSVTSIGDYAFMNCNGLTSLEIPDSVITIGDSAFYACRSLTSLEIPDSVTTIGESAFSHCTGLTSITIPDSVTTIGELAFIYCTGLTSITIPNSITAISNHVFYGCTGLTSIEIPDSVTSIGDYAFSDCTGLTSIEIPDSVETIGGRAFSGCTGLTSIAIPDSVTTIGSGAFNSCSNLTTVNVPCTWDDDPRYSFAGGVNVNAEHDWVNGTCTVCEEGCPHTGGTATCLAPAVCEDCGLAYGDKNPDNHASDERIYRKDATEPNKFHNQHHACCDVLIADTQKKHDWDVDGKHFDAVYTLKAGDSNQECVIEKGCVLCQATVGTCTLAVKDAVYTGFFNGYDETNEGEFYSDGVSVMGCCPGFCIDARDHKYTVSISGQTRELPFTITPAPLTVTANSVTVEQYGDFPELSYTADGFLTYEKRSDEEAAWIEVTDDFVAAPTAKVLDGDNNEVTDTSKAGTYRIVYSGGVNDNYEIIYTDGMLTVTEHTTHTFTQNEAGEWVCVCDAQAVATVTIGDEITYYTDFAKALAAWTDGTTLTLLDNVTTESAPYISGGTRTLDLNGKTWQDSGYILYISNAANVTITDSSPEGKGILRTSSRTSAIYLEDTSVLTLAGGTVDTVEMMPNGVLSQAQFIMTGGTLTTDDVVSLTAAGSLVKISGGTVEGEIQYSTGEIDLSEHDDPMGILIYTTGELPENPSIKLPEGYALLNRNSGEVVTELTSPTDYIVGCDHSKSRHTTAADKGDDTHSFTCTVCEKAITEPHTFVDGVCVCTAKAVAQVEGTIYADFAAALAAWTDGTTLTLLDSVSYDSDIDLGAGTRTFVGGIFTLDLGDKNISNKGTLTINGGTITTANNMTGTINNSSGTLILSGNAKINNENNVAISNSGALTVTGGELTGILGLNNDGNGSVVLNGTTLTALITYGGDVTITDCTITTEDSKVDFRGGKLTITDDCCEGWVISNFGSIAAAVGEDEAIDLPADHYLFDGEKIITSLESYRKGTIKQHDHNYTYTADEDTDTITYTCTCGIGTHTAQLFAPAAPLVHNGEAREATVEATDGTNLPVVSYTLNDAPVNSPINAGDYTATMTWGDKSVYVEYTIEPKPLTATAVDSARAYNTTTDWITLLELDGIIGNDEVRGWAEFTLPSANVGEYTEATINEVLELEGADAGNYTVAEENVTFVKAEIFKASADKWSIDVASPQDVLVGSGLNALIVPVTGTGINGEVVQITAVTFYTDAAMQTPATDADISILLEGESITLYYVADTKNYESATGSLVLKAIDHQHVWTYAADEDSNTITATCSGTIGTCPDAEQSFTLNAPDAVYSGNPVEAEVNLEGMNLTYALHYTGTVYDSEGAPTNAGDYTVTMTVGDKSVSDTFTISPKDISVVASCQFSLTEDTFTYSGKAPVLTVTAVDNSVGSTPLTEGIDYTVGTVQVNAGSHKLTVTGKGNYTGSVELDYSITAKPITIKSAVVADVAYNPAGYTLTVKEVVFEGVVEGENLVTGVDFNATAGLASDNAASDAATATVTVTLTNTNYSLNEKTVDATFAIMQSGTEMTATADKNSYTYGETITVTGTVKATGTAPATTLTLRSAPVAQQVALFAADGIQLTDPVNVVDGAYTLTYNTADKGILPAEAITLTVKFVGDEDMADAAVNVSIALTEKQLTATEATATTRAYEPDNTTVSVTAVTISGVIGTDDVKVDATNLTGEISSSDAGTYTSVKLADLTLIGSDKAFYTISDATVTTSVEITPKEITNPTIVLDASSFVYDGTEKKPAVTSVKDGDDLIDAAEYTVSYANNIKMGTATVTLTDAAGGNYTVSGSTTFQITQSGTEMTATADKNSYTYGETITVTGTVKATGTAPATTLTLRSAPVAQQVALFAADGTQLTDPVNVVEGAYTLIYNTADKGILPAEAITLTVKFVGDDNMADQSAAVTVALTAKSVEPVLSGSASKEYDGTDTVTDASNLTINLNGIIAGDTVSAVAAGYAYADGTVGQSKSITANGITLSGEDNIFYTRAQTEASAQIGEIKKAMLISVTEPADTTLDVYCADADTVIGKLPDTVIYHLSDGKTVELKVEWSCTAYDSTPGATNAFAWAVSDSDKLACYEIAQNVADDGTVIVTNSAFLPVTVTGTDAAIIYNGTTYDVTQMFAIDSNAGTAVFEIIGGGIGEGTLNGSVLTITKAGTITIKVTTAPNAAYAAGEATAILTISKGTPAVTAPTGLTAWYGQKLSDIALPTVDGGAWSWTDMNSSVGDSGVQIHQAIFTPTDINLWNITTHNVSITVAQAGTSFGEMKVYNGNAETTTFTYGETITVKAEATAVQPATFSLRSLIAPTKHQMALFIRNADGSEVQISEAVNEQNGVYTMTYNTTGKALSIGDNALIAKFVGDENMADYQETVLVTLNPKKLTIISLTAQDRVYEPGNQQVTITGTEVSGKADANDDVSAIIAGMTAMISSEDVGTYDTALIPQDVSLTGSHAGYYFATGNVSVSIPQGVEITQAMPYTTSGTPAQPVFDPIYQDGMTLGDIPVSLAAGTFNVPGTIEWEAPGNTPVTEGTPFTWVFTPDDSNWKPVTGTVVIYPDGEPPVITAPAGDQEVTVYEGEQGTMAITAEDAASYQWYINRYDGLGFVPISGATSASYTTSVVNLGNNGFTYYCVASNAYGETESPVFLLQVLEKIEVPETGDESNIALWTALAILSFAGLTIITMNGRRSKITR